MYHGKSCPPHCLTSTFRWHHGFGRFSGSDCQTRFWWFSTFCRSHRHRIWSWPHPNSGIWQGMHLMCVQRAFTTCFKTKISIGSFDHSGCDYSVLLTQFLTYFWHLKPAKEKTQLSFQDRIFKATRLPLWSHATSSGMEFPFKSANFPTEPRNFLPSASFRRWNPCLCSLIEKKTEKTLRKKNMNKK